MDMGKQPLWRTAFALTVGLLALSVVLASCGATSSGTPVAHGPNPATAVATATASPTTTISVTATRTPRPSPTKTPHPPPTPTKPPRPTATPTPAIAHVNIVTTSPNPYGFSPGAITVKKGTKVVWTNMTSVPHTVTSDAGDPVSFDSGTQLYAQNSTYAFTFTVPGTYTYHCSVHPYMTATIVVTG